MKEKFDIGEFCEKLSSRVSFNLVRTILTSTSHPPIYVSVHFLCLKMHKNFPDKGTQW
jgi:hypothetical protein